MGEPETGNPTWIIGSIVSLYTGSESAEKCGGSLLSSFPVRSGGCVLATALFNICMDWLMGSATIQSQCGATVGNIKFMDFDFTDNIAILF